jgi:hypothetical protein
MKHYTLAEWVEFARGVLPAEVQSLMQQHLAFPCEECRHSLADWRMFRKRASTESEYQPPEEAVRQMKALFGFIKPYLQGPWPLRLAERIFDSNFCPLPADLRSASTTACQMVYRSGDCLLELRLQPAAGDISVVGQVHSSSNPAEVHSGARVVLWDASIVAEATSNEFGEFALEGKVCVAPWILVEPAGHSPMLVRLPKSA